MKHFTSTLALMAATAIGGQALAQDVTIKVGTVVSGDHPENVGAREFERLVEERSNGEIDVRVFTDAQLGNQREMVEQLRSGTLEITWVTTGFFGSWEPVLGTLEIGYLFEDREHAFRAFAGPLGDKVAELVEPQGVELLGFYEAGMRHLTNSQRAVNAPDDIEGLKIRTPRATYHLRTLEMMGANATPMAFNELYTAMEQGVVDGQENPLSNIYNAAFYEVNDHLALTGHLHLTHMVLYSGELWGDLSEEHQEIVRQAVLDSAEVQRAKVAEDDANLLSELEAKGMQVTRPDREALAAAVAPLRDDAVEEFGDAAQELLDMIDAARAAN
ncbi:putative C4-dicarboxylate transport system,C4-dicarboxylate-binding protein precursor SIGNAL [Pseudooceanicola batsensis HTCC2597]|uniref:Putative C4-dicarboxylate transport system,C4-dicarboxylate-binding protein SIGNAL n=1 Tax=Pseudooceanicola batsensis (strain ATCC BAA-863 / DSM 15984 / KCTC 12145 / HTCC2597) TaxID=252305 RepID=A3TT42_PSEBH|nr:sialic acid TRAP transporter substrate-binding protein SiaP [Pseudooceanicola batsensis]EAQ04819.1 putative C4-dicarboxylate transport system,C4-dicarboxylate-binding protein precursor SIGNAL [Pseudooceanicola batsensis HTCC2597]